MTLTVRPAPPAPVGLHVVSRHLWWVLGIAMVSWSATFLLSPATSWDFFDTAARAVLAIDDPHGGLHLYHYHPDLQFGPVTVLTAVPFVLLPPLAAQYTAAAVMAATGLLMLRALPALIPAAERWRMMMAGLSVIPAWAVLAVGVGHLDDVIALTATMWALVAVRRSDPLRAAVLLALAADAKPWALAFVPVLLALPSARRRALTAWAAVVVAFWSPFLIADPGSVAAAGFRLAVSPSSVLRLFDGHAAATPWWCRPVQLLGGAALGYLLWRRNRTVGVVAAVVSLRVATDPATWAYYTAGLAIGAALLDLARMGRRPDLPWLTILTILTVLAPATVHIAPFTDPTLRAWLRLICCVAILGYAVFGRYRDLLTPSAAEPVLLGPPQRPSP